jgi:hypothetical protein
MFQKIEMFYFSIFSSYWAAEVDKWNLCCEFFLPFLQAAVFPVTFIWLNLKPQMEENACQETVSSQEEKKGGFWADEIFKLNLIQSTGLCWTPSRKGGKKR